MPADRATPQPHPAWLKRSLIGLFAAAVVFNLWALVQGWGNSLRDAHEFRQFQTALSASYLKSDGLSLAYETPVLGPPWSIPMEFPTYQAVVAKLSQWTGLPLEQAGRLTSLLFFYCTLPALWLLLRRRLPDPHDRLVVLSAILVSPIYLFYSRTFMIESTALCLSAWFLLMFDRALDQPRGGYLAAVWILGALAAITKVTTFGALWIACALLMLERILANRRAGQDWLRATTGPVARAWLAAGVPLIAGFAWVFYSDNIKELNPYGSTLTSDSLSAFNLGTLAQRLSYEWWRGIGYITFNSVLAVSGLVVLLAGLVLAGAGNRRLAAACVLAYPGGFLVFANLYYVHDYYSYASGFLLLAAFGIAAAGMLRSRRLHRGLGLALIVLGLAGQVYGFFTSYHIFHRRSNPPPPTVAELIRELTPPDDVFAGFGFDWVSMLPYYAERRGILPFNSHARDYELLERSLAGLEDRRVVTVAVADHFRRDHTFLYNLRSRIPLTPEPLVRMPEADIYVHRDRAVIATEILLARTDWGEGVELNIEQEIASLLLDREQNLREPRFAENFSMMSPTPHLAKGETDIGFMQVDGANVVSTQAPTELHFTPPPGSRTIEAVAGMVPASYSDGNATPGVVVRVFEQLPDGTRRTLFERMLTPLTTPGDRGDVIISHTQDVPFTGTLVFAHHAIPTGDVSYSWSYWKRITIR